MTANIECEETVDYECEEGEEGEAVNYEREAGKQEQGAEEIAPVRYNQFAQLQTEQMKEYQKGMQSQMEAYHAMMREQMLHQPTMQQQFTHQHKQLLDVLAMSCNARAIPPPLFPPLPPCPLRAIRLTIVPCILPSGRLLYRHNPDSPWSASAVRSGPW